MKALTNLSNYLQSLSKKEFKKYLIIFISAITLLTIFAIYYVYNTSSNLTKEIKTLEKLANETIEIINKNAKLNLEENKLKELLNKNMGFNIKTYFEQFIKEQNITPEANWGDNTFTQAVEGNDKFDEVVLTATFKNQTMQELVKILDVLKKNEMLYIKQLLIKNQDNKKIEFTLTLAAKKYKK